MNVLEHLADMFESLNNSLRVHASVVVHGLPEKIEALRAEAKAQDRAKRQADAAEWREVHGLPASSPLKAEVAEQSRDSGGRFTAQEDPAEVNADPPKKA